MYICTTVSLLCGPLPGGRIMRYIPSVCPSIYLSVCRAQS